MIAALWSGAVEDLVTRKLQAQPPNGTADVDLDLLALLGRVDHDHDRPAVHVLRPPLHWAFRLSGMAGPDTTRRIDDWAQTHELLDYLDQVGPGLRGRPRPSGSAPPSRNRGDHVRTTTTTRRCIPGRYRASRKHGDSRSRARSASDPVQSPAAARLLASDRYS